MPTGSDSCDTGVSPTRLPSTNTSAHGRALMLISPLGSVTDTGVTLPAITSTVRTSRKPTLSFSRPITCGPAGSDSRASSLVPTKSPLRTTRSGIGDWIET